MTNSLPLCERLKKAQIERDDEGIVVTTLQIMLYLAGLAFLAGSAVTMVVCAMVM